MSLSKQLRIIAKKHFGGSIHRSATSMSSTLFDAADRLEKLEAERTQPPCLWDSDCNRFIPVPLGEEDGK